MEYTDMINRLRKDYQLQPSDVFFAIMVAAGCGRAESYYHIYKPNAATDAAVKNGAAKLAKERPAINKLISDLQARRSNIPITAELPSQRARRADDEERRKSGWDSSQSPEENVKRIMVNEMWKLDAKEKIQESRNLAKLLGVTIGNREITHYYIPISCRDCNLYRVEMAKRELKTKRNS